MVDTSGFREYSGPFTRRIRRLTASLFRAKRLRKVTWDPGLFQIAHVDEVTDISTTHRVVQFTRDDPGMIMVHFPCEDVPYAPPIIRIMHVVEDDVWVQAVLDGVVRSLEASRPNGLFEEYIERYIG